MLSHNLSDISTDWKKRKWMFFYIYSIVSKSLNIKLNLCNLLNSKSAGAPFIVFLQGPKMEKSRGRNKRRETEGTVLWSHCVMCYLDVSPKPHALIGRAFHSWLI